MTNVTDVLSALADPTRRMVFERLAKGPRAVGELAQGLPVSRPAVSQHLKVLKSAGLVADRPEGTRRVYSIDPDGLGAVRAWLDQFWDRAMEAFRAELETATANEREPGRSRPHPRLSSGRRRSAKASSSTPIRPGPSRSLLPA